MPDLINSHDIKIRKVKGGAIHEIVPKQWYFITEIYCPICGVGKKYRERRYGKKPEDYDKTHDIVETYDGCQG